MELGERNDTYYDIHIAYEVPTNVMESDDLMIQSSRTLLTENLRTLISSRFEILSRKLTLHQNKDNFNYIIDYQLYLRSNEGFPVEGYVDARDLCDEIKDQFEDFFEAVDVDYRFLNIKQFN